jgi:hypothetical protein
MFREVARLFSRGAFFARRLAPSNDMLFLEYSYKESHHLSIS